MKKLLIILALAFLAQQVSAADFAPVEGRWISIPDNPAVNFDGDADGFSNDFTILAWINVRSYPTAFPYLRGILGKAKAGAGNNGGYLFRLGSNATDAGKDNLTFTYDNGAGTYDPDTVYGSDIPTGVWTFVGATYHYSEDDLMVPNGTVSLWRNGVLDFTTTPSMKSIVDTDTPLHIGDSFDDGLMRTFDGQITDVKMFDRVLTSQEIYAIYKGSQKVSNLVDYWPLQVLNGTYFPNLANLSVFGVATAGINRSKKPPLVLRFRR